MSLTTTQACLSGVWASAAAYIYVNKTVLPLTAADFAKSTLETQAISVVLATLSLYLFFAVVLRFIFSLFYDTDPLATTSQLFSTFWSQEKRRNIKVDNFIDDYNNLYHKGDAKTRESNYQKLVNAYYELATQFYEWGWGQSFHFASRMKDETFHQSIKRHEYYLAGRLNVKKGSKILDCGCGIGGPMRNIARFTDSQVVGITINEYQVQRGNEINKSMGLFGQCQSIQGDFMKLPFGDNEFDAVYAIEATCHAPRRQDIFREIMRVLKPGGVFVTYEWCLTDKYDPKNAQHRRTKALIEEGDGLPDMISCDAVVSAAKEVGFEIAEARDLVYDNNIHTAWYTPLSPSYNILSQRFQFNPIGRFVSTNILAALEKIHLVPQGTNKVQTMLLQAAIGLVDGGVKEIFTPMFMIVAKKTAKSSGGAAVSDKPAVNGQKKAGK
eukprot:c15139_g1_i1.p1 GENE.c15139_g1_i1~~c15139_g1_i1.p1  ORF type:complete len:440 (+),score=113.01 c15139_g1_i1:54-1373(+)